MMPAWGPPEQLVAREGDQGRARLERLAHGGLRPQPRRRSLGEPRARGVEQPGAQIGHHRRSHPGQLGDADRADEAFDPVVRGVHLEQQRRGLRLAGPVVVGDPGAVGGPHLDQPAPDSAMISGIRKPPPISTSSPRDTTTGRPAASAPATRSTAPAPLLTTSASLGPAGPRQQPTGMVLAGAAPAVRRSELEVHVARLLVDGQGRSAEVGVEQHPGGVDHRLEPGSQLLDLDRCGTGVARRDGGPGGLDQQRVGQPRPGQRPGQGVDRGAVGALGPGPRRPAGGVNATSPPRAAVHLPDRSEARGGELLDEGGVDRGQQPPGGLRIEGHGGQRRRVRLERDVAGDVVAVAGVAASAHPGLGDIPHAVDEGQRATVEHQVRRRALGHLPAVPEQPEAGHVGDGVHRSAVPAQSAAAPG